MIDGGTELIFRDTSVETCYRPTRNRNKDRLTSLYNLLIKRSRSSLTLKSSITSVCESALGGNFSA